jgi:hypothetical protein
MLALAVVAGAGNAWAESSEDDEAPDTRAFRQFMHALGFKSQEVGVDYRERAPLVVPPKRDLPPPQSEDLPTRNPAWPKDPDVIRRQQEATAAEKAKLKSFVDRPTEDARILRPDEMKGTGPAAPTTNAKTASGPTAEEAVRPLSPQQLGAGTATSFFDKMFSTFSSKPESAPFTGEPPRTSMTAPPAGYQTPSPDYPYGVGPSQERPKPSTVESRMEPAR